LAKVGRAKAEAERVVAKSVMNKRKFDRVIRWRSMISLSLDLGRRDKVSPST
jgi:hypothetical protein